MNRCAAAMRNEVGDGSRRKISSSLILPHPESRVNCRRVLAIAVLLLAMPDKAQAQAQVELVFPSEMGRTGVFRMTGDEPELQVQARIVDAQGRAMRSPGCDPTWSSASPEVLTVIKSSDQSGYVRPRAEGITALAVTYPCAPTLSRSIAVVVGAAAIDKPFAASGTEASYYPARLELTPPGNSPVSEGRLYLLPDDKEIQFIGTAYNGKDGRVSPAEFPMKWSIKDPEVLAVAKQYDHTVFLNPVGNGTTTVTFTVEGLSQSFEITVDDSKPPSNEGAASLKTSSVTIPPVSGEARTPEEEEKESALQPLASSRTITTPALAVNGTAVQLLTRSVTSPVLGITGTAIQTVTRTVTTPPFGIVGMAVQLFVRSITTPALAIQGQ